MATTVHTPAATGPAHRPDRPPASIGAKLRAPGFYRATWLMVVGVAFATFMTWVIRMGTGHQTYHHYLDGEAILILSLFTVPIAFLTMVLISLSTQYRLPAHVSRTMVRLHTPESVALDRGPSPL